MEEWYDKDRRTVRKITKNFISRENGFYVRDNHFTYSETGQPTLTLLYIKEGNSNPLTLVGRVEYEYLEDCSFLQRLYEKPNSNTESLVFSRLQLTLYDEECRYARFFE